MRKSAAVGGTPTLGEPMANSEVAPIPNLPALAPEREGSTPFRDIRPGVATACFASSSNGLLLGTGYYLGTESFVTWAERSATVVETP
jgi:hypothetical protein